MRLEPKEEGMRWLLQARQDLDDAKYCFQGKRFNLACFLSQQAAEKAVKAFIYAGLTAIAGLLRSCTAPSLRPAPFCSIPAKFGSVSPRAGNLMRSGRMGRWERSRASSEAKYERPR